MSEDPGSGVQKPMEPSSILEAILIFIGSLLLKAIGYLSAFTHTSHKSLTPPKNLSDLPVDVVSLIVERLDYKEQLILRKVSKFLRSLIDKQNPACKSIRVTCLEKGIEINMNEVSVAYTSNADYDALMLYEEENDIIVIRDDYRQIAFDDLASTLKNPRLQLDYFNVDFDFYDEKDRKVKAGIRTCYNNLKRILEPLSHQLSVKTVELDLLNPSTLLSILPYLKPGFLEKISILLHDETRGINWRIGSAGMDQVALLDQWKQAEVLELEDCFERFPIEYATHFKRFYISEEEIETEKFIRIKDYLSKLQNLEQCTLSSPGFSYNFDFVPQVLGAPVSSSTTGNNYHHPIPDSNYYLEFTKPMKGYNYEIKKKKREDN